MSVPLNPYQAARARFGRAIAAAYEAQRDHNETGERLKAADAEVDEAGRVLDCFAIDPEYRGPRHMTGASA